MVAQLRAAADRRRSNRLAFEAAVSEARSSAASLAPLSEAALGVELRSLLARTPSSEQDLLRLEAELFVLGERISASSMGVPEFVWHFLSDADIRFKDSAYSQMQNAEVLAYANKLGESGGR